MANAVLELIVKLKDEASSGIGSLGSSLGAMVNPASLALVAVGGVGAAFAAAVPAAANFESALNKFSAVSGVAGKDLKQFSDLALKMGAETQFSAQQAADAMVELAKGGIDPATIAAGGLEGALALAAAGQLELATAAGIVAKQLGVWADQGVTATDVANQFAQAANASTVDVDELALGMANVGGVAKVAGLSFKETTQAMALLAPGFSSAADAGTSFKAFLNNLTPTTDKAIAAFSEFGLLTTDSAKATAALKAAGVNIGADWDIDDINSALETHAKKLKLSKSDTELWLAQFKSNAFYDAQGNFVGMDKAAEALNKSLAHLSPETKALALETMFGADAQRAAAILVEKGKAGYDAMGEAMTKAGTAAEQAAKMNQGLNFAMESLKGSLETILIVLGSMLLPILTQFVNEGLIPAANGVLAFIQALSTGQVQVGGFGEEFSGVFTAVQNMVATVMPIIMGIVSSVLASISAFWQQNGADIMATASSVWESLKQIVTLAIQIISLIVVRVLGEIKSFWDTHHKEIESLLTIAWAAIKLAVTTAIELVKGILKAAMLLIQGDWKGAWEVVKTTATTIWDNIKKIVEDAIKKVESTMGVTLEQVKKDVSAKLESVKKFFVDTFNSIVKTVTDQIEAARTAANNLGGAILSAISGKMAAAEEAILGPIRKGIGAVEKLISGLWASARSLSAFVSGIRLPSIPSAPSGGGTVNTPVGPVPGRTGINSFSAASGQGPVIINIYSRGAGYADVVAAVNDALRQAGRRADARVLVGG